MATRTSTIAAKLCLIGTMLIFLNVLAIAYNGSSIVVSSYPVSGVEELVNAGRPLWYRISFGVQSFVEGPLIILWLIISVITLISSISLYLNPDRPRRPGLFIFVLSIISFLAGGGFIIGSFLAIFGSGMGYQWRTPIAETFFGKLIRAAKLDSKIFLSIKKNPMTLREAAIVIMLVSFLSGLGSSLYIFNVNKIAHSSLETTTRILLLGETLFDLSIFNLPLTYIGLSILKWILLSLLIYFFGSKLPGKAVEFDAVARVTAFAHVPLSLQVLMPFVFLNQPFLTDFWPSVVVLVADIWMVFALIVAVKALFEVLSLIHI